MEERARTPGTTDEQSERPAAYDQWDRARTRPRRRPDVGTIILAAAVLAIAAIVAYGVAHTPSRGSTANVSNPAPASVSNAQKLADLDGDNTPPAQYQAALLTLEPECTQDETGIAALANAGYQDLVKYGITDETRLTVLRHLAGSIPAGLARVDCAGILSAYLVLREG